MPNAERIFFLGLAFQRGWTVEQVFEATKIDPWFLENIRQIVGESKDLAHIVFQDAVLKGAEGTLTSERLHELKVFMRPAKKHGFSDRQIATQLNVSDETVRKSRIAGDVRFNARQVGLVLLRHKRR